MSGGFGGGGPATQLNASGTTLDIEACLDGKFLKRSGTTIVGDTPVAAAHATTHQPGGADAMVVDAAAATGSLRTIGTGATQACAGNDARLSDSRTPVTHGDSLHDATVASLDGGGKVPIAELPTGTTSTTVCVGNDARLSDARAPLAHTHSLADITDEGALAAKNTVATADIDNDAVTYAKIQNVAASRLLGRDATGAGDVQEIVLGTNLTLSGTTLNAAGGGGTPADTVSSETSFGVAAAAGSSADYSRGDHTHGTPSLGTTGTTACAGNDTRLSDARTPTAHEATHRSAGSDPLSVLNLGGFPGGTSTFLRADATFAAPEGGGGGVQTLKKTADQIINGTAFQDIAGLTFPVTANTDYAFDFYITFRSAQTTTGFRFSVNGPAGVVDFFMTYQTIANSETAGVATWLQKHSVTFDAMTVTSATIAANVDLHCRITGRFQCGGAGGTFAARAASELANNDLVVQKGSWGTYF